ncbi:flippase [bacterium LRH843]|nr:flippase [bacterium LRH843]
MKQNSTFAKNSILTMSRHVLSIFLGLLVVTIIARVLGPEGQGKYALIILLPTMLVTLGNMGVQAASVYYIGRGDYPTHTIFKTNVWFTIILSLISIVVGIIISLLFGDILFSGVELRILLLILLIIPILYANNLFHSIFQGMQDFSAFNVIIVMSQLVTLLLVVLLVLLFPLGLTGALISFVMGQLTTLTITVYLMKKRMAISLNKSKASLDFAKKSLSYGWKAHLSNILAFVNYRADILLISYFMNPIAVGIYVIAVSIAEKMWVISQSISSVLFPRISSYTDNDLRNDLTTIVGKIVLYLSIVLAVFLFFSMDFIINLLFGKLYLSSSAIIKILLPGIVLFSMDKILSNDLAGRGLPVINTYTSLITVILNVSLNLFLIPRYGLSGAATATSASYMITWLIKVIIFSKMMDIPIKRLLLIDKKEIQLFSQSINGLVRRLRKI